MRYISHRPFARYTAADRAAVASAPVAPASPAMLAWIDAHPAEYQWLIDSNTFDFAVSLLASLRKWGKLTDGQLGAVQRILAKKQAQAVRHAAAPALSLEPVEQAFAKAQAAGIKRPKLRLGVFTFSPAPATGVNAGAVYVKEGEIYLGKVLGGRLFAAAACTVDQESQIVAVGQDPLSAAIAYGKEFGKCSVCARTLSDPESIARGIGPVCADRFGW